MMDLKAKIVHGLVDMVASKRQSAIVGWGWRCMIVGAAACVGSSDFAWSQTAVLLATPFQDTTPSPSDAVPQPIPERSASPTAPGQTSSGVQLGISDSGDQAPPATPSPQAGGAAIPRPVPLPRTTPQVAGLGSGNYSALVNSPTYVSPLISMAGIAGGNSANNQYFGSASHRSLLQTPEMFGDFRRPGSAIAFDQFGSGSFDPYDNHQEEERPIDFPSAASFSGLRISENNYALPQDRIWFGYGHFHNAFAQPGGDLSLDRFVFGYEKTFSGNSSIEVRLPMAGAIDPSGSFGGTTSYAGGSFGNLAAILKRVLYADDRCVLALGLGIESPTGSQSHAFDTANGPVAITLDPSAVYLTPYVGGLRRIDDIWFAHGFFQVDVPTSGDNLIATIGNGPSQTFKLNQSTMLQIDLGLGAWLVGPDRYNPTGIAMTSELHIATALNDADSFSVGPVGTLPNVLVNQEPSIRTLVNSTTGLQATLRNGWSVRTGIAVPLLIDRIFDTEAVVQVNRRL